MWPCSDPINFHEKATRSLSWQLHQSTDAVIWACWNANWFRCVWCTISFNTAGESARTLFVIKLHVTSSVVLHLLHLWDVLFVHILFWRGLQGIRRWPYFVISSYWYLRDLNNFPLGSFSDANTAHQDTEDQSKLGGIACASSRAEN